MGGRSHDIECDLCHAMYGGIDGPSECPCTGRTPSIDSIAPSLPGDEKRCTSCGVERFVARTGIDREAWNVAMWNLGKQKLRADALTAKLAAVEAECDVAVKAADSAHDALSKSYGMKVAERWAQKWLDMQAERDSALAAVTRMTPVYEAAVRFPGSYSGTLLKPPGDWACIECQPTSDWPDIGNGWQCPVHALLAAIAEGK